MMHLKANPSRFVSALAWLVYVTAYLGRINLSITIPFLQNEFGYSKTALGFLASGFFVAYAAGQLINGIIGDRVQVRYFVSLGLIVAGISNLAFSFTRSFPVMFIAWSLNGYFQSMLWGPLLRTISEYTPAAKLYKAMFLMSTTPVIGYLSSYLITGRLVTYAGWEAAYLVPGILFILMAGTWYLGIGKINGNTQTPPQPQNTGAGSVPHRSGDKIFKFIFHSKIYLLIILGIFIGIAKEGLTLWGPAIFTEFFSQDLNRTLYLLSVIPIINFFFVILNGLLYKKNPELEYFIIIVYLAITILSAFIILLLPDIAFFTKIVFFYGLMASLYVITNNMTSYLPFNFMQNGRVSASAGIIDSSLYLGAAIAGPLMGTAADKFGWNGIFVGVIVIGAAAVVPCLFVRKR